MIAIKTAHIRKIPVLVLSFCLLAIAQGQTPREVAKRTLPSVVMIIGENNEGKPITLGSGFFVREDIIATNNHVIEGASSLYAKARGNRKLYKLELIIARPRTDLALLKIVGIRKAPLLLANFNQVGIGDEVYAVGNPSGLEGTFSQGVVSGIRKTKSRNYLQISAPISSGSSGGPILNKSGKVIGIAVGGIPTNGNLNFAIPVSELARLLNAVPKSVRLNLEGIEHVGEVSAIASKVPPKPHYNALSNAGNESRPNLNLEEIGEPPPMDNVGLYVNKEYKFKIEFPKGWMISNGEAEDVVVRALDYSTGSTMNIVASEYRGSDPTNAEFQMLVRQLDESIRKDYPTARILDKGIKIISNRKALYVKYSYTFTPQIGTFTNTVMSYTTSKKGIVYTITASTLSNNFYKVEPIFIKSIASFTIEN
jgi:S1-C subfamily serine protease